MEENASYAGEQRLTPEARALVEEAYARLKIWTDGCREMHERARTARKIMLLQDPYQDDASVEPKKRALQLQTLVSTINNCVADQMDNVMEAVCEPETPDLQAVTDDMNDVLRYVLDANDYQALHRLRVEDYLITGTSVLQTAFDEDANGGNGEVAVFRVPLEAFLWDPAEAEIQDARALFKASWRPMSWYRAHYPDAYAFIRADEHARDGLAENENQEELGADEPKAMLLEYWRREYDARARKHSVSVAYLAGGALLYEKKNAYAHGMYPFIVDAYSRIEGLPVGEGLVMQLAPMMRYINRYAQYMDANIRASAKMRLLVNRAAGLDAEALSDWTRDFIEGDRIDDTACRFLQSPALTSLTLNQMVQYQTDLKQDSGQNQFTRGETAGGVTAASAIASLQEAGGKQTRMRTEALKRGFKRLAEQTLWLIAEFYDEGRARLITGRDGALKAVDMSPRRLMGAGGKGAIAAPRYAVRIQVQRMNPQIIGAQNQLFIDAYRMAAQSGAVFPLSALFRILNIDGKDRLLPVIDEMEARQDELQRLTAQNAQQQEAIQGLQGLLTSVSGAADAAPLE